MEQTIITPVTERNEAINFAVEKVPATYFNPKTKTVEQIRNGFTTIRTDTGEALAMVGSYYKVRDHQVMINEMQDKLFNLFGEMEVKHTVQGNGAKIYTRFRFNNDQFGFDLGGNDHSRPELVYVNTYDGSKPESLSIAVVRLICSNGMTIIDELAKLLDKKHSGIRGQDFLSEVMNRIPEYMEFYGKFRNIALQSKRVDTTTLIENSLFPTRLAKRIEDQPFSNAWEQYNAYTHDLTRLDIEEQTRTAYNTILSGVFQRALIVGA
jgi:hypothetical protein